MVPTEESTPVAPSATPEGVPSLADLRAWSDAATPGPWIDPHFTRDEIRCDCKYVFGDQDFMGAIATVHVEDGRSIEEGGQDDPPQEEAIANARLLVGAVNYIRFLLADGPKGHGTSPQSNGPTND